jgi:hypothetical protein
MALPGMSSPRPQPGPMDRSVASVFHGLRNSALAPKPGRNPRIGPAPRPPGSAVPLASTGRGLTPDAHNPAVVGNVGQLS